MNTTFNQPVGNSAPVMIEDRISFFRWDDLFGELDAQGCAIMTGLLTRDECRGIAGLYPQEEHFRSHIHMSRHGFGKGEYRYFRYPFARPDFRSALGALSSSCDGREPVE